MIDILARLRNWASHLLDINIDWRSEWIGLAAVGLAVALVLLLTALLFGYLLFVRGVW